MSVQTNPAVAEYVGRIQAALADLPAAEVEEIVEDISQHLSEIAGELGDEVSVETLSERLGTPEQYAAELRAAAGYPPASGARPAKANRFAARVALWGLVLGVLVAFLAGSVNGAMKGGDDLAPLVLLSLPLLIAILVVFSRNLAISAIVDLPEYRAVVRAWRRLPDSTAGYLRSLRPAWWLIRIVVLVLVVLLALRREVNGGFAVLPLIVIAVLIWFGKRARTDRRWAWIILPANVFAVGVGLALLGSAWSDSGGPYRTVQYVPPGLINDGRYLENVYVFGPDGKPLSEAYLYDEHGQPINVPSRSCDRDNGRPTNKVPQPTIEYGNYGGCREVAEVPFTVAIPRAPTSSTGPPTTATTTTGVSPPPTTSTVPPPTSK